MSKFIFILKLTINIVSVKIEIWVEEHLLFRDNAGWDKMIFQYMLQDPTLIKKYFSWYWFDSHGPIFFHQIIYLSYL